MGEQQPMNEVSFLTLNDETREIVDAQGRNYINNLDERVNLLDGRTNLLDEKVGLLDERTNLLDEKVDLLDERVSLLELVTDISDFNFNINNYKQLSIAAQTGEAENYVNIGDQVIVPWSPDNKMAAFYNLPFDVVAINFPVLDSIGRTVSKNIWLQSHYSLISVPFYGVSENNAFYVTKNIMPAGTYYFIAGISIGSFVAEEKYHFTLTQDVPANGQLVFSIVSGGWTTTNNLSSWRVNSYNSGFESTPIETVILESGQLGTEIGTLNQSSKYSTTGMNCISRIRYGYNRYSLSTVRQWCNGIKENGLWWEPLDPFERCSNFARTKQGFMAGLPKDFINIINPVQIITKLNSVSDDEIGNSEISVDKFFLPSLKQQNINVSDTDIEESILPYWIEHTSELDRKRYKYDNHTNTQNTWMRSPVVSSQYSQRYLYGSGTSSSSSYSHNSCGVTPMCVIY